MVVGSLDRVALGMRELSLNYIRCPALLVEHGRCHSAKPVCRERRAVVAQAAKRSVDRVLAHRFAIRANAREDPWAAIGQGPQIYQDPDHLSRQRHDVHDAALHLRRRGFATRPCRGRFRSTRPCGAHRVARTASGPASWRTSSRRCLRECRCRAAGDRPREGPSTLHSAAASTASTHRAGHGSDRSLRARSRRRIERLDRSSAAPDASFRSRRVIPRVGADPVGRPGRIDAIGFCADPGEDVALETPDDLLRMRRGPVRRVLLVPLPGNFLERVGRREALRRRVVHRCAFVRLAFRDAFLQVARIDTASHLSGELRPPFCAQDSRGCAGYVPKLTVLRRPSKV